MKRLTEILGMRPLWILEDNADHQFIYRQILSRHCYLRFFSSIDEFLSAEDAAKSNPPALLIADLQLPDGYFLDILIQKCPHALKDIPFVVVTSVVETEALRAAFMEGAIDYLIKPFRETELIVKLERALLAADTKRSPPPSADLKATSLEECRKDLTYRELQLFNLFAANVPDAVSLKQIIESVWADAHVQPNAVHVHLYNLRRKLSNSNLQIIFAGDRSWRMINSATELPTTPTSD